MESPRIIRFGVFEADIESGELRKSGLKIKVREQSFQILAMLLERSGEVVSREELRQRLWPDETFVDFDHGLNAAVNRLREALGDAAGSARFIETVPRRGYRFVASVQPVAIAAPAPAAASAVLEAPVAPSQNRRWIWVAVAMVIAVAGAAGAAYWIQRASQPALVAVPITSDPETEAFPSLSPDGNYVTYSRGKGVASGDIFVRQIGEEKEYALTSDPLPDVHPSWSPDGRWIAFLRYDNGRADVYIVPAMGGTERKIATLNTLDIWTCLLSWHPDGQHLVVSSAANPGTTGYSLSMLSVSTGALDRLTPTPDHNQGDYDPSVSPDGTMVAFTRAGGYGFFSEIHVLRLSADLKPVGMARQITSKNLYSTSPVWTPDGTTLVFVSGTQHRRALWQVPAGGGKPTRLSLRGENLIHPTFASRKPALAYMNFSNDVNVWRTSLEGNEVRQEPLLASTQLDHLPEYAPDGRRITFVSDRSGFPEIWIADADGRSPYRLTSLNTLTLDRPKWSPDGRTIAFRADKGILLLDVSSRVIRKLNEKALMDVNPAWSPDARWIYFHRGRTGAQIWKQTADGSTQPAQVTQRGGEAPMLSPDSKYLYFVKVNDLWRMPVDGGDAEELVLKDLSNNSNYVVRDNGVYFIPRTAKAEKSSVVFLDFASGSRKEIAPVTGDVMWGLAVSPDGKWILHSQVDGRKADLMLVENFR